MELVEGKKVFIKLGFTDMRKQINGLSAIVQELRTAEPFDGSCFLFCGKIHRVVKLLYWDRNGFCLWQKRLEPDSFPWPKDDQELTELKREKVLLLLRGIDLWKEHKPIFYHSDG